MGARLPKEPTPPGEMLLEEYLKPLALTQSAFAEHIGVSFKRINEIVNGRRSITPETAWLFSQALGTTPRFWMSLQTTYDLVHHPAPRQVERVKARTAPAL
jgi:addiction module HigA family antidote